MAFPKKKSRRIIVDNIPYRCVAGPNDGYNFFYAHIDQEEHGALLKSCFPQRSTSCGALFQTHPI